MKDFSLRDWLYIAAIVGAAAVANYRLGALETRFAAFEQNYVRADVFKLTMQNVSLEIQAARDAAAAADLAQHSHSTIIYRTAQPSPSPHPQVSPSIIPQYP